MIIRAIFQKVASIWLVVIAITRMKMIHMHAVSVTIKTRMSPVRTHFTCSARDAMK